MKYKVGDRVKIRDDLQVGDVYNGIHFTSNMLRYRGKVLAVGYVGCNWYIMEGTAYLFSEGMIEGLADDNKKGNEEEKKMKDFKIIDYKVYDNKVIIVEFDDGTKEKAICCDTDSFDFERGVEVCVLKHVFGEDGYKSILKEAMKQIKAVDKSKGDKQKEQEIAKRRKDKAEKRKARRIENRRKRRVAEMKEAYLAAMKEYENVDCAECKNIIEESK